MERRSREGRGKSDGWISSTLRDQVILISETAGVPILQKIIIDLGVHFYGCKIPSHLLSSLLAGGEATTYKANPEIHTTWICPALTVGLLPLPQLVTVSSWPLETRLIGARSLRVIHLKTLLSILTHMEKDPLPDGIHRDGKMRDLLRRFAETVPGAIKAREDLNYTRIREATYEELVCIEPDDIYERAEASLRLESFPEPIRLWGNQARKGGGDIGIGEEK